MFFRIFQINAYFSEVVILFVQYFLDFYYKNISVKTLLYKGFYVINTMKSQPAEPNYFLYLLLNVRHARILSQHVLPGARSVH